YDPNSDKVVNAVSNNKIDGSNKFGSGGTNKGRAIRFYATKLSINDSNQKGWGMIPLMSGQKIGYYSFGNAIDRNNVYYSVGTNSISASNSTTGDDIYYDAKYYGFNYPRVSGTKVSCSMAYTSIDTSNIFSTLITDRVDKYDGNWKIVMGDGQSGAGDLNVYSASTASGTYIIEDSSSKVTVFAGCYGGNRSYWLVPRDIDGNDVGFCPTQHWAGPNIGGVVK
ncbi:MAG: hypothetical protein J6T39_03175, partial [Clostridia bacterium]|nr:hypothetical protein [Clostridia bacterium]